MGNRPLQKERRWKRMASLKDREQITIRHPADQKKQLQREAEKRGVSYNALITEILNEERNHRQTK